MRHERQRRLGRRRVERVLDNVRRRRADAQRHAARRVMSAAEPRTSLEPAVQHGAACMDPESVVVVQRRLRRRHADAFARVLEYVCVGVRRRAAAVDGAGVRRHVVLLARGRVVALRGRRAQRRGSRRLLPAHGRTQPHGRVRRERRLQRHARVCGVLFGPAASRRRAV